MINDCDIFFSVALSSLGQLITHNSGESSGVERLSHRLVCSRDPHPYLPLSPIFAIAYCDHLEHHGRPLKASRVASLWKLSQWHV